MTTKLLKYSLFWGLAVGLLADFFLKKFWNISIYKIPEWMLIIIFIFYSFCIFGFFYGSSVFSTFSWHIGWVLLG